MQNTKDKCYKFINDLVEDKCSELIIEGYSKSSDTRKDAASYIMGILSLTSNEFIQKEAVIYDSLLINKYLDESFIDLIEGNCDGQ